MNVTPSGYVEKLPSGSYRVHIFVGGTRSPAGVAGRFIRSCFASEADGASGGCGKQQSFTVGLEEIQPATCLRAITMRHGQA